MNVIVGDIGGTKSRLAILSTKAGPRKYLFKKTYSSLSFDSIESILNKFTNESNLDIEHACFGVAGPVVDGRARITNLPWVIDALKLQNKFDWKSVRLLNDLEAVAYSIIALKKEDLCTIQKGDPDIGENIAVISPGTGLGQAFITRNDDANVVNASEGSHASFGPTNTLQDGLLKYLREKNGNEHVSVEMVCSGKFGIPNIYEYLKNIGYGEEPKWLAEELAGGKDPAPIIINIAKDQKRKNKLCTGTLDLFVSILGSEAGNLALKVLSTGGIYLGGGIPSKLLDDLKKPIFIENLKNKGRFKKLLEKIPIHVILAENAGLIGAAVYLFEDILDR
ncbi:MAG: glucokinase [Bacteroidetes bacterium]|jgi:glucokinase|nr:glucokinase [Bacteroidota bacterium]MBT3424296.1 glucokinase [Bacteroidota bacterium]MBT6767034.1 glucokinase [Prolixibacteraceae bacterium]